MKIFCATKLISGPENLAGEAKNGLNVQLLPVGEFAARDGRPGKLEGSAIKVWKLDSKIAAKLVQLWEKRTTPLVVDYEHQTYLAEQNGQPAPAAGWITELKFIEAKGLCAKVVWTEKAKAFIEAKEYLYLSPVFQFDPKSGEITELLGAALTNNPALDGLSAVKAKNQGYIMNEKLKKALCAFLGATDTATDAELLEALENKSKEQKAELTAQAEESTEESAEEEQEKAKLKSQVPLELFKSTVEQVATLRAELEGFRASNAKGVAEALLGAALKDGRLTQTSLAWAKDLAAKDLSLLKSYLDIASPIVALSSLQSNSLPKTDKPMQGLGNLDDAELAICRACGLSAENYLIARGEYDSI